MTRVQQAPLAIPFLLLMLSQPVFGQNSMDPRQADAENAASKIISAVEQRFDCKLEEYAMQNVGIEPNVRYIFFVKTEGADCRQALIVATRIAEQGDKLMFRQMQVEANSQRTTSPSTPLHDSTHRFQKINNLLIYDDQVLIHEVNPKIDDVDQPEG
jgi:hypothetical protein